MQFVVLRAGVTPPNTGGNNAYLVEDDTVDGHRFTTQYALFISVTPGSLVSVGNVKIGQLAMAEDQRRAAIPERFDQLADQFFSVGQDNTYYEQLTTLGQPVRDAVLIALRDLAANAELFTQVKGEKVTTDSLLLSVTPLSVQGQFRRLARGGERTASYRFKYTTPPPQAPEQPQLVLTFEVQPESNPPSNIHVLIGRNGVGKTRILNLMTRALVDDPPNAAETGVFEQYGDAVEPELFANLVSVTFSAFDPFEPMPDRRGESVGIRYSYVGLKNTSKTGNVRGALKNLDMLTLDFVKSFQKCVTGSKSERWRVALETLEADPIFREASVASLADEEPDPNDDDAYTNQADAAASLFGKLSTGHKIVLLTITRLIETVEERTLVLIDEPESHLHPPLLSAFIRALSDLLIERNGVAIVATHSPVVLQEVPAHCSWKLRRRGDIVQADRPEIETFGENVGVLTREVFGLEVTHSGFHKLLSEAVEQNDTYDAVINCFSRQLGGEARAIIRALVATRAPRGGE